MKQVVIKQGQVAIETVPAPQVEPGHLLVRVDHSCISAGTEVAGLAAQADPLWLRALKKPRAVKTVLQMAATHGIQHTRNVVEGKLAEGQPTGYSAAGVVLQCGDGIDDLKPGDRVACAGAQCAHHAEVIRVPRNLTALIPEGLDFPQASTVTLGAIALQGVRRAQPTLGETFVVIGLGILGQLTAQMLSTNGCRVLGVDLDLARRELAGSLGMDYELNPDHPDLIDQVHRLTSGYGADGVIVTAASSSDEIMSQSFQMCRRKGRVVLVGAVGLNLNREDFYKKEIDFLISTSYGPGRYDAQYEEKGLDYPIGYVRWTENRNMTEYLQQIAEGKLQVTPLIQATYPVNEATQAYAALREEHPRPLIVLLSYPQDSTQGPDTRVTVNPEAKAARTGQIRMALVGAGGFLKGMHLPNLQTMRDRFHIPLVVSRSGPSATNTARQCGAPEAATDLTQALNHPEVDALLITTPHDTHGRMTLDGLQAGKHVLVEKPLTLKQEELDRIIRFYEDAGDAPPVLLTGFNRRFSPFAERMAGLLSGRSNPMIINYRMNAGYIPLDHPLQGEQGGGRNLGEACHIYDLFTFLTQSRVVDTQATPITPATGHYSKTDNFVATFKFEDGSVATLTYTALGHKEFPKERMDVFSEGRVYFMDDYRKLTVTGVNGQDLETRLQDKGHRRELERFAETLQSGGEWPIPLWQQAQATQMALDVQAQLKQK